MSVDAANVVAQGDDHESSIVTPVFGGRAWLCDTDEERARTSKAAARAAQGDRDALQYLYVRYSGNVYRYVRSLVRDEHEAEDVTQSVFLKLMSVLPQYEEAKAPFSGWILRVARNLAIDHLRRRQPILAEEVFGADTSADETGRQCAASLREALAGLPEEQRRVLLLRQVRGMTPREIAQRLGKTEGSVHALYHRARTSMQASLAGMDAAPATMDSLKNAARARLTVLEGGAGQPVGQDEAQAAIA
jgi:RNA polymerase sigma-70 factor (ECF subfamily)